MDTRVPETSSFWRKKGRKALKIKGWKAPNQLVRMRSPVQIRIAAPKSLENFGFQGFFIADFDFLLWVKMWANWLTHTVIHTRKGPESVKECRAGSLRFPPGFFSALYDLLHKTAHGGCCLVLLLPCCVGIGAEGEPGIVVPQHGGHRLYVHAVLEGCGSESVPQVRQLFINTKTKRKKKAGSYRKTKLL